MATKTITIGNDFSKKEKNGKTGKWIKKLKTASFIIL